MTQDFIRERQYLKAVSPKTIIWYGCSFSAFHGALESTRTDMARFSERIGVNTPKTGPATGFDG